MCWLASQGAWVYIPVGHSPHVDLIADFVDELVRVQVKTSNCWRNERWEITLCTRGGNQRWNGLVKLLDRARCDALFVHSRRWPALVHPDVHRNRRNPHGAWGSKVRRI